LLTTALDSTDVEAGFEASNVSFTVITMIPFSTLAIKPVEDYLHETGRYSSKH
jgi:hypothetical protein